jgi:EmrB/QacA subfamily drug resistance transporter
MPDVDKRLLGALIAGVFIGALDLTILVPALPAIGESFQLSPVAASTTLSVYAAFYAATVPLVSKLSDLKGYKPFFLASFLLFGIGSIVAALASNLAVLVGGRVIQAIGGGGLFPLAQATVGTTVPEDERGTVFGILLGVFAIGAVLGPNLGGFLVQEASWRWIFWIHVPLVMAGASLLRNQELPRGNPHEKIDWGGAVLVAVTFGSIILSVESLRDLGKVDLISFRIGGFVLLSLIGLGLLIPYERRQEEPVLNMKLIGSKTIAPLLLISTLVGYALLGGVVFLPLYVQLTFGASALGAGAALNAAAVGLGLSSWLAGELTNRTGPKPLVTVGMGLVAAGLIGMILLQTNLWGLLAGLLVLGGGLGLAQGLAGRRDAVDKAHALGLLSLDDAAGEDEVERVAQAHDAR